MTPELAKMMVEATLKAVYALDDAAEDYRPDDEGEFHQSDTVRMRSLAQSICIELRTAASLVSKAQCSPFAIATYFEQSRNYLEEYGKLLSKHILLEHVMPKYRPYNDLYYDLVALQWEVSSGHAGFETKCQCGPK